MEVATKVTYCEYCKERTVHEFVDEKRGDEGALRCTKCGSSRLNTIQGFDASLM